MSENIPNFPASGTNCIWTNRYNFSYRANKKYLQLLIRKVERPKVFRRPSTPPTKARMAMIRVPVLKVAEPQQQASALNIWKMDIFVAI